MKRIILVLLTLSFNFSGKAQKLFDISFPKKAAVTSIQTKLKIPFGTIAKLEVEVCDGDSLKWKRYTACYLLKVNFINEKPVRHPLFLNFIDDSETLANDDNALSMLTYDKPIDSLTEFQFYEMKRKYVGKKFKVMAYETGKFTGTPDKYFDYSPTIPGVPHIFQTHTFLFEHSLIVVSNLTK